MKSAELQVEWWGLSGSPIYYYKFKWQIQDTISFFVPEHGNVSLRRSELQKYPDLVKRFDDLRPTDIEITFKVKLERNVQNKLFSSDELDGLSRITYFQYAKFEYDKTLRHVPHIMIGKSGKVGDNISPGSPRNYRAFIDMPNWLGTHDDAAATEKRLSNTFKDTGSIIFTSPQIEKLTLPEREMIAIWKELQKREKKEEPEEEDFWDEDEKDSETDSDDFWDQEGKKPDPQQKSDFWDGETGLDGKQDFEIKKRYNEFDQTIYNSLGQTMGIENKQGRILIPFKDWEIISYKNGFAKVEKNIKTIKEQTCVLNEGWSVFSGKYIVATQGYRIIEMHQGLVDSSGGWLTKPIKVLYFDLFETAKGYSTKQTIRSTCPWKYTYAFYSKKALSEFEGQGYKIRY